MPLIGFPTDKAGSAHLRQPCLLLIKKGHTVTVIIQSLFISTEVQRLGNSFLFCYLPS